MPLVLKDRVKVSTTTTGTGTLTLGAAAAGGFQDFSVIGNGNTTYYAITDSVAAEFEVGIGIFTSSGTTLSRDTVLESSNAGALVNFAAGPKDVFCTYPAEQAVTLDDIQTLTNKTLTSPTITGGTIDNTVIGGTTPAAGTFTTLTANSTAQFGRGSANYFEFDGAAATQTLEAKALGSDTNIAFTIDSKGTGAINLAPGSSGVNISNGGTVTAITRTAGGSLYTSVPAIAISAPTTAGGVQATASINITLNSVVISSGGTGYTVGDVLTVVGGTGTAVVLTVGTVSVGVITAVTISNFGAYSVAPSNPMTVTGGTGTGATFTPNFGVQQGITITNAGSGYVEQPTVTFSGGGGSGAAAYASVGGVTELKFIGTGTDSVTNQAAKITTSAGTAMTFRQIGGSDTFWQVGAASGTTGLIAKGNANGNALVGANGTGSVRLTTGGDGLNEQLRVTNTTSAVNYVQVTGAATGTSPNISSQGSDSFIGLQLQSKSAPVIFITRAGQGRSFNVADSNAPVNFLQVQGNTATNAPILSSQGSDTNIDLVLTPKGTGNVRFGTFTTLGAEVITGYIEVKDSGGTIRKLAVIA
jgi:hypothetical protein